MKLAASLAAALGILALAAASAGAAWLDRNGTWTPTQFHSAPGPDGTRTLINDGSFEQGPPPASAWTEVSNSPNCEWIGDWASTWYLSSWDGYFDYWAGGYCFDDLGQIFPVTSSVSQAVTVPVDASTLSFFYAAYRVDADDNPPDGDRVYVAVNGVEVWSMEMIQANNSYPSWVGPILVNLGDYGGQDVTLAFGGVSVGDVTGNVRFDYIEFVQGPTAVPSSDWGAIKALYR